MDMEIIDVLIKEFGEHTIHEGKENLMSIAIGVAYGMTGKIKELERDLSGGDSSEQEISVDNPIPYEAGKTVKL